MEIMSLEQLWDKFRPTRNRYGDGSFLYVMNYTTNNYYNYVPSLYSNYDVVITNAYSNGYWLYLTSK